MSLDLSIVIVSWNVAGLLRNCLDSVQRGFDGLDAEVWVVDNASTEGTVAMVQREFPWVKLQVNAKNLGFPAANNQVTRQCQGRHVLYLNPDVIVRPGSLTAMVHFLDRNPDVGLVGPKIMHPDGSIEYDCARNYPSLWAAFTEISFLRRIFPRSRWFGHQYMTYWDHLCSREVPCLVGACMMVRREALHSIGYDMDARTPMYFEDMDFCYRVRTTGWRVFYCSEAEIVHVGGQSTKYSTKRAEFEVLKWQSYELFFRTHGSPKEVLILRLMVFLANLVRIPVILAGMAVMSLWRRKSPFFSSYTLAKSALLIRWSLGLMSSHIAEFH